MKHIVITEHLSAADIRPPGSLAKLAAQSVKDSRRFFGDSASLVEVNCPACDSTGAEDAFEKHGFKFRLCDQCGSLFVSPRPTMDGMRRYYEESDAGRERVEYFTEISGQARMRHVVESRVDWIAPFLLAGKCAGERYLDCETIYPHLFEEMRKLDRFELLHSVDADPRIAAQIEAADVLNGWPEAMTVLVATAFEQLEHQAEPADFLGRVLTSLADGGLLFLTTRTASGFDFQVLWESTPYIFVPEHLNLLSIEGLETLFSRVGFELLEISTPGRLDVEFVREAANSVEGLVVPRFVRSMLNRTEPEIAEDFQAFLQKHRLSSHVRVAARRKTG